MTGSELRRVRVELGWTQARLAEEIGVTQGAVSMMEDGQRPVTPRTERQVRQIQALQRAREALGEKP